MLSCCTLLTLNTLRVTSIDSSNGTSPVIPSTPEKWIRIYSCPVKFILLNTLLFSPIVIEPLRNIESILSFNSKKLVKYL